MGKHERVWAPETPEYKFLNAAASLIEASRDDIKASVKVVYLDFGQDWKHSTIIIDDGRLPYQIGFNELDDIMSGDRALFNKAVDFLAQGGESKVGIPYYEYRKN